MLKIPNEPQPNLYLVGAIWTYGATKLNISYPMGIVGAVLNLSHCRVVFPQYWNSVVGAVGSNYWTLWFATPNLKPSEIAQERRYHRRWIHCPHLGLEATGDALKCEIWTAASLDCRLNYHICLRSIKINPILNYVMRSADIYKHYSIATASHSPTLIRFALPKQKRRGENSPSFYNKIIFCRKIRLL